jgi:hypothetical protein
MRTGREPGVTPLPPGDNAVETANPPCGSRAPSHPLDFIPSVWEMFVGSLVFARVERRDPAAGGVSPWETSGFHDRAMP